MTKEAIKVAAGIAADEVGNSLAFVLLSLETSNLDSWAAATCR
jgi:hypothetical protein